MLPLEALNQAMHARPVAQGASTATLASTRSRRRTRTNLMGVNVLLLLLPLLCLPKQRRLRPQLLSLPLDQARPQMSRVRQPQRLRPSHPPRQGVQELQCHPQSPRRSWLRRLQSPLSPASTLTTTTTTSSKGMKVLDWRIHCPHQGTGSTGSTPAACHRSGVSTPATASHHPRRGHPVGRQAAQPVRSRVLALRQWHPAFPVTAGKPRLRGEVAAGAAWPARCRRSTPTSLAMAA